MAKIYVTIEIEAKDKLEAGAIAKSLIKDNYKCKFHAISTSDPYEEK